MSNAGIPLRVIQEISGHRNLEQLQRYLEVTDAQVLGAVASLAMLSPVAEPLPRVERASSHQQAKVNAKRQDKKPSPSR
jgi:integrase/recombinase XerD